MVDALECFTYDNNQKSIDPSTQIDNVQNYNDYLATAASPFATRFDNPERATRRSMTQFTIDSNTSSSAVLRTTLKMNLGDYPPFTNDNFHLGLNSQPLKIDISWYDFLPRLWARAPNHPAENLSSMSIQILQPTVHMLALTLPFGQTVSNEQNFPYHQIDCQTSQTTQIIQPGADFSFDTGTQQLNYVPSRIYLFAKPSDSFVTSLLYRQVNIPNCFSAIKNINISFANRSGILSNFEQQHLFHVTKSNGLIPSYAYCDWLGTNNPHPLRGGILALDIVKDLCSASKTITTGLSDKTTLQIRGTMTNVSGDAIPFDIMLITVYDGVFSIINRNMGVTNLSLISDLRELTPLDLPYSEVVRMMGGGDGGSVKSFFKGLWEKVKEIVPIIRKSGVIGNVLSSFPQTAALGTMAKSIGFGDGYGDGAFALGDGEGDGEFYGNGEGEGAYRVRRKKKISKRGGYLA